MKIYIEVITRYPEFMVTEAELATLGKKPIPNKTYKWNKEQWINKILASHSTLRCIRFRIILDDVRSDVARQLVRHKTGMVQPYMQSKRPDWTGEDRPTEPYPCRLIIDTDIEGWRNLASQRLCTRAMKETREAIQDIVRTMKNAYIDAEFFNALAAVSVPRCELYGGCPEEENRWCKYYPMRLRDRFHDISVSS